MRISNVPKSSVCGALFTVILIGQGVIAQAVAGGDDLQQLRKEGETHALGLDGCAFLDGYVCPTPDNSDFLNADAQDRMISGNLLKAWQVALLRFESRPKKEPGVSDLKHYKFGFTESEEHYIILFQGLLLPHMEDGEPVGFLSDSLGTSVKYWVRKDNFKVEKELLLK